ncbi:MAG: endo alpha-1,4 polygalactosaminidase [Campylobacterota bacterium]|nr:endo alpha-1,4 polygalactosaminidase [Campylobacterota bacterium]
MRINMTMTSILLTCVSAVVFTACGGSSSGGTPAPKWYQPTKDTTWQWQLQPRDDEETVNITYDVDLYDIDLFNTPQSIIDQLHKDGRKVICYISAGTKENNRPDSDDFPEEAIGNSLENWDEWWVDIRNEEIRDIMTARMDLAVEKNCDGIEPDNIDAYTNDPGFDFTAEDQLEYNTFLADEAHKRGLSIGLKNDLNQIKQLVDSFDFVINEQCYQYDECDLLMPFIEANKPVFNAEYDDKYHDEDKFEKLCKDARERGFQTLFLPNDLDDSFRFTCNP